MKQQKGNTHIIDSDGHVRETDEEIIEYMSVGYRNRRENASTSNAAKR